MPINFPQNFDLASRLGFVEGFREFVLATRSPDIQTAQPPITLGSNNLLQLFATANESWEIVSDNAADDDPAGTGARSVLVAYLDSDYVERQAVVQLNGTSAVPIAANCFRHQSTTVITAGSGATNTGRLTIRVAGGGAVRGNVSPAAGASRQGSFTVPAGYRLFLENTNYIIGRAVGPGVSASIGVFVRLLSGVILLGLDFSIAEPGIPIGLVGGLLINEKITLEIRVLSVSANDTDVSALLTGLLVDTTVLDWPQT